MQIHFKLNVECLPYSLNTKKKLKSSFNKAALNILIHWDL